MKVLLVGAGGQIGRSVSALVPVGCRLIAKDRRALSISDGASIDRALNDERPDWVVNAAAYTAVDLAEDQQTEATLVNEVSVGELARASARHGARLLHLSTDFVFDGTSGRAYTPADEPNPLSAYGRSKLGGDRMVQVHSGDGIVLRTAWVYAAAGKNFVLTMLRLMNERDSLSVVCDQIGAPTWAMSAARAIWGLINVSARAGIYHWTDLGVASWYDFAVAIQEEALARGLLQRAVPIRPIRTAEYPSKAVRPAFSVLDSEATRAVTQLPGVHWRANLRAMLDELRAA